MTTDKERAEVMRELAAELSEPTAPWVAESYWNSSALMHKADKLDPPRPTYPDGQLVTATVAGSRQILEWSASGGMWRLGGDPCSLVDDGDLSKVEPLRVLADDEIAVTLRPAWLDSTSRDWRKEADYVSAPGASRNLPARALCLALADALDAKAGGAK